MNRSSKITIIVLGALSIGAGIYAFIRGDEHDIPYFALFCGVALIGTALLTRTVKADEEQVGKKSGSSEG